MYRCEDCGHIFEEGEQAFWTEPHGEILDGCPLCKGNYEEVEPCKICGSYNHDCDDEYCEICKKNVKQKFSDFVKKNFTKEERELLNELYDGEWI